jgi:hypothetical protein
MNMGEISWQGPRKKISLQLLVRPCVREVDPVFPDRDNNVVDKTLFKRAVEHAERETAK